jgi:hypothetical protein
MRLRWTKESGFRYVVQGRLLIFSRPLDYREVEVTALDILTPFTDFEDYWRPFLGGQGPAPAYAMALDETARARLRDRIRSRIPLQADGSICFTARAWAVRATAVR